MLIYRLMYPPRANYLRRTFSWTIRSNCLVTSVDRLSRITLHNKRLEIAFCQLSGSSSQHWRLQNLAQQAAAITGYDTACQRSACSSNRPSSQPPSGSDVIAALTSLLKQRSRNFPVANDSQANRTTRYRLPDMVTCLVVKLNVSNFNPFGIFDQTPDVTCLYIWYFILVEIITQSFYLCISLFFISASRVCVHLLLS